MKISIITVTFNSDKTLAYTLYSTFYQTYKKIEHIIIDGGSTDQTLNIINKYKFKNKKLFVHKNTSIYEAINIGIKKSSGDYILILNSDDILDNKNTIKNVVKIIKKNKKKIILGSVTYFNKNDFNKEIRGLLDNIDYVILCIRPSIANCFNSNFFYGFDHFF
jgi:glycosyltransferase involved in cell wall biosynthesis